jgi:hypothetical protein
MILRSHKASLYRLANQPFNAMGWIVQAMKLFYEVKEMTMDNSVRTRRQNRSPPG